MSSNAKGHLSEFQREDESRYQVEARSLGVKAPYLSIVLLSTLRKRLGRHPCRRIHVHTRGRTITEPASLSVILSFFSFEKKFLTLCSNRPILSLRRRKFALWRWTGANWEPFSFVIKILSIVLKKYQSFFFLNILISFFIVMLFEFFFFNSCEYILK